ncbi:MAG: hypothetical protein IH597_08945 [Bacteroidales bacterium]|nr:hypothetical protein [Bacteroidales bacterium]
MRLLYLTLSLIALTFFGCQKHENSVVLAQQYVVFSIGQVDPVLLKSNDEVECHFDASGNLKIPTVAEVIINGVAYYPDIFFLNGKLYTQSIKLDLPGGAEVTYNVSRFALLETPGGEIVMATPTKGSYYASYVSTGVDFDIDVTPYKKTEVKIDVLCFVPWDSILFGFHTDDKIIFQNTSQHKSKSSGIIPFGLSEYDDLEPRKYSLTN